MIIVPAVLATTKDEFIRQIESIYALSPTIQIDIADGLFVPNTTVSIDFILAYLKKNQNRFHNHQFDFHLMVKDWKQVQKKIFILHDFIKIHLVLIHYAVWNTTKKPEIFHALVFNPQESIDMSTTKQCSAIQIMTITPGKQGSIFLPENLSKITQLRQWGYTGEILIDGGINNKTLPVVLAQHFLPDTVVVGSYLTTTNDPQTQFSKLKKTIHETAL